MARPVTLFTGQWADMQLDELAKMAADWGYDGLELANWGDHFDVFEGAQHKAYCEDKMSLLSKYGLKCWAISNHLAGQLVLDEIDERHYPFAPSSVAGNPAAAREWAIESMKNAARAARNLGVDVVTGFTGSSIWHLLYLFPPVPEEMIEAGYDLLKERWNPILDVFGECGVKFALEVHPSEIAFDLLTAQRTLEALDGREEFGFNFDPSHLQWQGVSPAAFIHEFSDRIFHVHVKDCAVTLDGRSGILSSYLNFGTHGRGWDFRSPGRGEVDFEEIVRALNHIGYDGPLSVEWEDSAMDRKHGAEEAVEFVRSFDFEPSKTGFEKGFEA
ncbi:MAG: sugar phosphate isomerase/epimerase family protein [Candidatus Brocadiia bacterium]|jgi:sugar phosphate isomerase/epimerase|nr:sugar phosphate isomerase/epimerase family protein [Candidatus Brocadiia bacterium]